VVQCWGQNIEGALGDTTFERRNAPVVATPSSDWRMLSLSESSSCAINADKELWCWGKLSIPFQPQPYIESVAPPVQIGKEHDWSSVAAGPAHACAITTEAEAYCFGDNGFGQLGDPTYEAHDGLVRIEVP
jgi:alpha-tubulin suppressor-like RCC1 family protein